MVDPLVHCLCILVSTRFCISSIRLSSFREIGFRVFLRELSAFRVTLILVVTAQPLRVTVCQSLESYMSFVVCFKYIGLITLWCHIGWYFVAWSAKFTFPFPEYVEMILSYSVSYPIKYHFCYSISFCFSASFTFPFDAVLSMDTGASGFECPISAMEFCMDVSF